MMSALGFDNRGRREEDTGAVDPHQPECRLRHDRLHHRAHQDRLPIHEPGALNTLPGFQSGGKKESRDSLDRIGRTWSNRLADGTGGIDLLSAYDPTCIKRRRAAQHARFIFIRDPLRHEYPAPTIEPPQG